MRAAPYSEQLQHIVIQYRDSGQPWPATARQIAAWALRERLWAPQRDSLISQCAEQLARAMREEYIVDPQGRTVRAKHAAKVEQDGEQLVCGQISAADGTSRAATRIIHLTRIPLPVRLWG